MSIDTNIAPHRFEDAPAMRISGITGRYTVQIAGKEIPSLWEQFINNPVALAAPQNYGVSYAFGQDDCAFTYMAGVSVELVNPLPPDWETIEIPANHYAIFRHTAPITEIGKTVDAIWRGWLPVSGYKAAPAPNFELYNEKFRPEGSADGLEIWIPVINASASATT